MKLGRGEENLAQLDISVSSIAAKLGADCVVVGTLDKFDYKNLLIYNKESLTGKLELYSKDGGVVVDASEILPSFRRFLSPQFPPAAPV
jgi:hypothetical protein